MKSKNFSILCSKRRGLSSIVGALIFVVLMVATFAVLGVALDSQTDIVDTSRDVADIGLKKQQEDFLINNIIQNSGENLQIQVSNKGQNPTEIFTIIITNSSDIADGFPSQAISIPSDASLISPNDEDPLDVLRTSNVALSIPGSGTENYEIKVISSLGKIQKKTVVCSAATGACGPGSTESEGDGSVVVQLLMDGPNGINTKNSTAVMFVTNTGDVDLKNVTPVNSCTGMFSELPGGSGTGAVNPCILDTPSPKTLKIGQTALFPYDMTISGVIGDEYRFCNGVTAQEDTTEGDFVDPSNIDCDELTVIDPNDCGGCGPGGQTFILIDDLLIRPSLFMIIPSPWGDPGSSGDGKGVWGINMVNPTERPMSVNKVTIVAYAPGGNDADIIVRTTCEIEGISPNDSNWECPKDNTIMWQDILNPINIPAYSSVEFLAKLEPGAPTGSNNIDALIVQANAQTTAGSFGKADYQSTMFQSNEVIANVYLTNSTTSSRSNDAIQSQRLGLTELVPEEFKITLADMDLTDKSYIKAGARLIINVPREWTDVTITDSTNFANCSICSPDDRITPFSDNSHQIIVTTTVDIGGDENGAANQDLYTLDAVTLTFEATPPLNDSSGNNSIPERLYIMYVLADGQTGHTKPVGSPPQVLQP
jgi:hypothetical protein